MADQKLASNSATLIMGDTGSGKTSLIATYAEWVFERYNKVTRFYAFDAGGFGDIMQALVRAGIVEVWRVRTRDETGQFGLPIGTCNHATMGYWPAEGQIEKESGNSIPQCDLEAPTHLIYRVHCRCGSIAGEVAQQQNLQVARVCPSCKNQVNQQNCAKVTKVIKSSASFSHVGAVAYDGLTSMGEWLLMDLNYRAGRNTLGGMKGALETVKSDGMVFGSAGMGGVGFAQSRVQDWPYNACNIRGLVAPPIFTSLELRTTDEGNLPIYGPKIPGKAKTSDAPAWFGNCLGTIQIEESGRLRHRLYLTEYREPGQVVPHKCKNRAIAGTMPEYLEDEANTAPFTAFHLGRFFELLDQAVDKASERLSGKFPDLEKKLKSAMEKKGGFEVEQQQKTQSQAAPAAQPVDAAVRGPSTPAAGSPAPQTHRPGRAAARPAARPPARGARPPVSAKKTS